MRAETRRRVLLCLAAGVLGACARPGQPSPTHRPVAAIDAAHPAVFWNSATVYFLLTDRFLNGDTSNDRALGRAQDGAVLRSFMGGDLKGVLRKVDEGYFDSLGVNVIWLTPFVEQIRGSSDEGTGKTYAYHGYWARDWTAVDPALGTKDDLRALVDAAHRHHIRVLMDAVINHTGPVTPLDSQWPDDWVRTGPRCTYQSYVTTVDCTLVDNLPDVRTDRNDPVDLPPFLVEKWRREGRLEQEQASLEAFFKRTGYPRAPRYYLIKWLTDWVREFGFDGYRMDTAKHFEAGVSAELKRQAGLAFADWKRANPAKKLDDLPFFMVGEVNGWDPSQGEGYSYRDSTVDFFAHGYDGLINFNFKRDADGPLDSLFTRYATVLHTGALRGDVILNYLDSHDDGAPYDPDRRDPFGAATRLLLAPGGAQIYYGDELARPLQAAGAQGDANLRSFMNWGDLVRSDSTRQILRHWRKLGEFRRAHPAVGAGAHRMLQANPYIFSRTLEMGARVDRVLVAMNQPKGAKTVNLFGMYPEGTGLMDEYSGDTATVRGGQVRLTTPYDLVLLSERTSAPTNDSVLVNVTNNYSTTMEIFEVGSGTVNRLGSVSPGLDRTFVLHRIMLLSNGEVQFLAQATGAGPRVTSDPVQVHPGDVVDFEISAVLVGSRAVVRP